MEKNINDLREATESLARVREMPGTHQDKFNSLIEGGEKKLAAETLAHNNEAFANIPLDVREKINAKFKELKAKNPKWSINRTLRKAGEFYKVKFSFE